MNIFPYRLDIIHQNSDHFYTALKEAADASELLLKKRLGKYVNGYIEYLESHNIESLRTEKEYMLDLLILGVLWNEYSAYAANTSDKSVFTMLLSAKLRASGKKTLKERADKFRNKFLHKMMMNEGPVILNTDLKGLGKLISWLAATAEFNHELARVRLIENYLRILNPVISENLLAAAAGCAFEFVLQTERFLGKFVSGLNCFIESKKEYYKIKEDCVSCLKGKAQYYLNMAGAEIMNRAYRKDFVQCERKALLIPGCLRIDIEKCKAEITARGLKCKMCDKNCRVAELKREGIKNGYEVMVLLHSSDLSEWSGARAGENIGLTACTCVPNLLRGGLELKSHNIAAQCVFTDYNACKKHWLDKDIPNDLNSNRLSRIMNNDVNELIAGGSIRN